MAARPPEEDWWLEEDIARIAEDCIRKVEYLPRGQKGKAYRECLKAALEGL